MKHDVDLVLVNPGGRARIYQSLANELAAIEPPVWAGLMASFVRAQRALGRDRRCQRRGLSAGGGRRARDRDAAAPRRGSRLRPPALRLDAGDAGGERGHARAEGRAPELPVLLVGGHVASLPAAHARRGALRLRRRRRGPATRSWICSTRSRRGARPTFAGCASLWSRDGEGASCRARRAARAPTSTTRCRASRGTSCRWSATARTTGTASASRAGCPTSRSTRRSVAPTTAPSAASRRRSRAARRRRATRRSVNSYRIWSPARVLDDLTHLVEHYGVRNVKIADEMFVLNAATWTRSATGIVERGLSLNIWAYARVDTVKEGMLDKLKRGGRQLARARHRGRQRARARRRREGLRRRARGRARSRSRARPGST